ncbi:hypothetical protein LTS02_010863 [Friedmanniomyces endolithicus]|nr:hypothetical protein LTS02_010863 [Friedmanniomyces endolithicus]
MLEEARTVVAQTNANGIIDDPVVLAVYKEIIDTLKWEKEENRVMTPIQIAKDPVSRKRLLIGMSAGPFSCVAGNIIASYYLGAELSTAGITSTNAQLEANVVLNVWCLFCSLVGTHLISSWGRKPTAILTQVLLTICLFIIGGLSKYCLDAFVIPIPTGSHELLYQGEWSSVQSVDVELAGVSATYLTSSTLQKLMARQTRARLRHANRHRQHRLENGETDLCTSPERLEILLTTQPSTSQYMINASWDIPIIGLIYYYWVETRGKTLEEIDAIFEGHKHSDVPDVELIRTGKEKLDVPMVEHEIEREVVGMKSE